MDACGHMYMYIGRSRGRCSRNDDNGDDNETDEADVDDNSIDGENCAVDGDDDGGGGEDEDADGDDDGGDDDEVYSGNNDDFTVGDDAEDVYGDRDNDDCADNDDDDAPHRRGRILWERYSCHQENKRRHAVAKLGPKWHWITR